MLFLTFEIKKVRTWWGGVSERVEFIAVANEEGVVLKSGVMGVGVQDCFKMLDGHRVVLLDGWCKALDSVQMEWYPLDDASMKEIGVFQGLNRLRAAAVVWKRNKEAAVERFMRAVHGLSTKQLTGMIGARAAGWARYVLDCMIRDCSMQLEGGDVVFRMPESKFGFYEGIGINQGDAQRDFCAKMTEGFFEQLYHIAKGI